jgi:hypothetical protein
MVAPRGARPQARRVSSRRGSARLAPRGA